MVIFIKGTLEICINLTSCKLLSLWAWVCYSNHMPPYSNSLKDIVYVCGLMVTQRAHCSDMNGIAPSFHFFKANSSICVIVGRIRKQVPQVNSGGL